MTKRIIGSISILGALLAGLAQPRSATAQCDAENPACLGSGSSNRSLEGPQILSSEDDHYRALFTYSPGEEFGNELVSRVKLAKPIVTAPPLTHSAPVGTFISQSTAGFPTLTLVQNEGRGLGSKPGYGYCSGSCNVLPPGTTGPSPPLSTASGGGTAGDNPGPATETGSDPVNPFNGEFAHQPEDLHIPGWNALDFRFVRTYRSRISYDGPLGPSWDHSYNQRVQVLAPFRDADPVSTSKIPVRLWTGNAVSVEFRPEPHAGNLDPVTVKYRADGFLGARLEGDFVNSGGIALQWRLIHPDGIVHVFDGKGLLAQIRNAQGDIMAFSWDPKGLAGTPQVSLVTDTVGRQITFNYDELGRLKSVTPQTAEGVEVVFSYDIRGRLETAKSADGRLERYTYDDTVPEVPREDYIPEQFLRLACENRCAAKTTDRYSESLCSSAAVDFTRACDVAFRTCESECQGRCVSPTDPAGCPQGCATGCRPKCEGACGAPDSKTEITRLCKRIWEKEARHECTQDKCQDRCDGLCGDICEPIGFCYAPVPNSWEEAKGCGGLVVDTVAVPYGVVEAGVKCIFAIFGVSSCDESSIEKRTEEFCNDECQTCCAFGNNCASNSCLRGENCSEACENSFWGRSSGECGDGGGSGCEGRLAGLCRNACQGTCDSQCGTACTPSCKSACTSGCTAQHKSSCGNPQNFASACEVGCEQGCLAANRAAGPVQGRKYGHRADLLVNLTQIYDGNGKVVVTNEYGKDITRPSFDAVTKQTIGNPDAAGGRRGESDPAGIVLTFSYRDMRDQAPVLDEPLHAFLVSQEEYESVRLCPFSVGAWPFTAPPYFGDFPNAVRGKGLAGPGLLAVAATAIKDAYGVVRSYYFRFDGRLAKSVNHATDSEENFQYDDESRLVGIEDGMRGRRCFDYNQGNLLSDAFVVAVPGEPTTDPIPFRKIEVDYTDFPARVKRIADPRQLEDSLKVYEWDGPNLLSVLDQSGLKSFVPGPHGLPTSLQTESGSLVQFTYDKGLPRSVTYEFGTPASVTQTSIVDGLGRPKSTSSVLGRAQDYEWKQGTIQSVTTSDARVANSSALIKLEYDGNGRIKKATHELDGREETWTYDAMGFPRTHGRLDPSGKVAQTIQCYNHGPDGRLLEVVLPERNRIRWTYDGAGRVTKVEKGSFSARPETWDDACAGTTALAASTAVLFQAAYDKAGRPWWVVDERGFLTEFQYGGFDEPTIIRHPTGLIEQRGYDRLGNVAWAAAYNSAPPAYGKPKEITPNLLSFSEFSWKAEGVPNSQTTWHFDENGKSIGDGKATVIFESTSPSKQQVNVEGRRTIQEFDTAGRPTIFTSPNGTVERFVYSDSGRTALHTWTDSAGVQSETVRFSADGLPSAVERSVPGGTWSRSMGYDPTGRLISMSGTGLATTTITHDAFGREDTTTRDFGANTEVSTTKWNRNDQIVELTSTASTVALNKWSRDAVDRTVREDFPDGTHRMITKFLGGSSVPTDLVERDSVTFKSTYEKGLLKRTTATRGESEHYRDFQYDATGRMLLATFGNASNTSSSRFKWDSLSNLVEDSNTVLGDARAARAVYSVHGELDTVNYAGTNVRVAADQLGRPRCVVAPALGFSCLNYDGAVGQQSGAAPTWRTDGNGTTTAYAYDEFGSLSRLTTHQGQASARAEISTLPELSTWRWNLDALDRTPRSVTARIGESLLEGSAYVLDGARRVTAEAGVSLASLDGPVDNISANLAIDGADSRRRYTLDGRGNWTTVNTKNGALPSVVDSSDRYASLLGQTPQYDAAGNISGIFGATLTYDPFGQLETISRDGVTTRIQRDGLGRMVRASDTTGRTVTWGYHGTSRVASVESKGEIEQPLRVMVPGGGLDQTLFTVQNGVVNYLHQGRDSSLLMVRDGGGEVAEHYQYSAYGEQQVTSGSGARLSASGIGMDIGFQGRPHLPFANTQFMDFRARTYVPGLGRFSSLDPIGLLGGSNQYAFVGAAPLAFSDPFGLAARAFDLSRSVRQSSMRADTSPREGLAAVTHELQQIWMGMSGGQGVSGIPRQFVTSVGDAYRNEGMPAVVRMFVPNPASPVVNAVASPEPWNGRSGTRTVVSTALQTIALVPVMKGVTFGVGQTGRFVTGGTFEASLVTRGLGKSGGVFSSEVNAAGGEVWTSVGEISQNEFATYVNSGLYKGDVNILTGVHGTAAGQMLTDATLFQADVARFGNLPGVTVHNIPNMTPAQITSTLQSPATTIGGFCNSGACLAPFK